MTVSGDALGHAQRDAVDRPHPIWWALVLGGLTLLGLFAFQDTVYAWWDANVYPVGDRAVLTWLFVACVPIHVFEGVYCWRLARRRGLRASATAWGWQSFFLGWPSTRLLLRRIRERRA